MLTPLLLPLFLVVGAPAASTVALRSDARPVTQAQAATMPPPALADALLAAGHPPIVATSLPERSGALPPPGYVPPLDVGLVAAATLDRASGFCVKHVWRVTGTPAGVAETVAPGPTLYRRPPAARGCAAPRSAFFSVAAQDRPRAFTIVRLLADAAAHPAHVGAAVSVKGDDAAPRYRTLDRAAAGSTLATLPLDRIFVVRHYVVTPLLDPAALTAPDGRPREDWEVFASDPHGGRMWSIHLALDGDRIVALRMVHQFPAPF